MKHIREQILTKNTIIEKMNIVKNNFSDKDFVILSCGPSLNDYSKQQVQEFCQDKYVLCIKQAYLDFKNICHFHFYNDYNISDYEHDENVITCSSSRLDYDNAKNQFWQNFRSSDFHFNIVEHSFDKTIAVTNNFSTNEIEKSGTTKTWGPGIILEAVFPFIEYIRTKKIYTLGWDCEDRKNANVKYINHYYSSNIQEIIRHTGGPMSAEENEKVILNSKYLNDYLKTKNIELFVLSKKSYVSEEIKRIEI